MIQRFDKSETKEVLVLTLSIIAFVAMLFQVHP